MFNYYYFCQVFLSLTEGHSINNFCSCLLLISLHWATRCFLISVDVDFLLLACGSLLDALMISWPNKVANECMYICWSQADSTVFTTVSHWTSMTPQKSVQKCSPRAWEDNLYLTPTFKSGIYSNVYFFFQIKSDQLKI